MLTMWRIAWLAWAGALGFCGCQKPPSDSPAQPATNRPATNQPAWREFGQVHLNHAQPKLPTVRLWVGSQVLSTEIAASATEVATGMMFRKDLGENEAMLFIFARPHRAAFYMRNTTVPLSAAYLDPEGNILEIHDLKPLDETPVTAESDKVQFVLETKQGWFARHSIFPGTLIRTELGSLHDTFLKRTPVDR